MNSVFGTTVAVACMIAAGMLGSVRRKWSAGTSAMNGTFRRCGRVTAKGKDMVEFSEDEMQVTVDGHRYKAVAMADEKCGDCV